LVNDSIPPPPPPGPPSVFCPPGAFKERDAPLSIKTFPQLITFKGKKP
jgi:hypothetical protein